MKMRCLSTGEIVVHLKVPLSCYSCWKYCGIGENIRCSFTPFPSSFKAFFISTACFLIQGVGRTPASLCLSHSSYVRECSVAL